MDDGGLGYWVWVWGNWDIGYGEIGELGDLGELGKLGNWGNWETRETGIIRHWHTF
jgi:hypothetical protein